MISQKEYNFMKRVSLKYAKTTIDAEDILSIGVIRFLSANVTILKKRTTYLYKLIKNTAINYYRGLKTFIDFSQIKEQSYTVEVNDKLNIKHLLKSIENLPKKQRNTFKLRHEGHSFKKIGQILDISPASAKINYYHSVKKLKNTLKYSGIMLDNIY